MKDKVPATCPGCSKHCPLSAPRCKYGRRMAEKNASQTQQANEKANHTTIPEKCKRGWKSRLTRGGVIWQLIKTGKRIKKALRHDRASEVRLMEMLTAQDQEALTAILTRLAQALESRKK